MEVSSQAAFAAEAAELTFKYTVDPNAKRALTAQEVALAPAVLQDVNFELPAGSRTLLCGVNGAGKSTLLEILAGRRRPLAGKVSVSGLDPFKDNHAAAPKLLGAGWASEISRYASLPVGQLLESAARAPLPQELVNAANPAAAQAALEAASVVRRRCVMLARLLEVDAAWLTTELSEGQKRRVQLACGLASPSRILLLDEVTAELDILTRRRLLTFLHADSKARGSAVVCCTHVFDGLGGGVLDSVLQLERGTVRRCEPLLVGAGGDGTQGGTRPLHATVLDWLSSEEQERLVGERTFETANETDAELFSQLLKLGTVLASAPLAPGESGSEGGGDEEEAVLSASEFSWGYKPGAPLFRNSSFALRPGSRCLLTGSNGAGKTTLLSVLSGARLALHSSPGQGVRTLGVDPSSGGATHSVLNRGVVHVSTAWRARLKEVVNGGSAISFQELAPSSLKHAVADLVAPFKHASTAAAAAAAAAAAQSGRGQVVTDAMARVVSAAAAAAIAAADTAAAAPAAADEVDEACVVVERAVRQALERRFAVLKACLGVHDSWVPGRVSAGQRARVQLCLQLLPPKRVLLMDEVTAELDVCARKRLLDFVRGDSEGPLKLCVLYATHVLEGLDGWASHVLHLCKPSTSTTPSTPESSGSARLMTMDQVAKAAAEDEAAAAEAEGGEGTVYRAVLSWLLRERREDLKRLNMFAPAAAGGGGGGDGSGQGRVEDEEELRCAFPSTAAQARAKQDASILSRSSEWEGRADVPSQWGLRTNSLPGGVGSHTWGSHGPGGGAGEDSGDAERRILDNHLNPDIAHDLEAHSAGGKVGVGGGGGTGGVWGGLRDDAWAPPPLPKQMLAPLPLKKEHAPPPVAASPAPPAAAATAVFPTAPSTSTAAVATASSSAAAAAAASPSLPKVPSSVLLTAVGALEKAVADLKTAISGQDPTQAKAAADSLSQIWNVLRPAVDQFAGVSSGPASAAATPAASSPFSSSATPSSSSSSLGGGGGLSSDPFGGPRTNSMSEGELINRGVLLGGGGT